MPAGGGGAGRWLARTRSGREGPGPAARPAMASAPIDVHAVRRHFSFPARDRIVLNNAASTQPPRELLALYQSLGPDYENVHRGQSSASRR
jgi:selenocysteine lyase/cysteine desulfurase